MKDATLMPSSDLHPVDMQRWLDFVPAQHGPVSNGKRPNRWETILILRKQLHEQMISRHAVDYMRLLDEYGASNDSVKVVFGDGDKKWKLENALLIDEAIGRIKVKHEDGAGRGQEQCEPDYTLTVNPVSNTGLDYWAITEGGPQIFHPLQDTTIVYLYLEFMRPGTGDFSLQDRIFWFDNDTVTAMAEITEVHQDAIIVVNDGFIVPVSASFWPRVLPPVDLEKSFSTCEDVDIQSQQCYVFYDKRHCPEQSKQATLWPENWSDTPFPRLAHPMPNELGNHIFMEVEDALQLTPDEW